MLNKSVELPGAGGAVYYLPDLVRSADVRLQHCVELSNDCGRIQLFAGRVLAARQRGDED